MSNRTIAVDETLYRYIAAHSLRESPLLARLREQTAQLPERSMQIAPEQGQFMTLLVELLGAERIVEIGTFTGYSAICMASALPPGGQLLCCDLSDEWTAIARAYWDEAGVADRIELRLAPALETLDGLLADDQAGHFDMAFIDADKTNYLAYYARCLRLVRSGGLILFDNTLWNGSVADPADQDADTVAIRELNDALLADDRISLSLVPIGDGLTLARKR
jgi:predicted O-methyltransferase YrrM